jgi:cobyrinic acid a,c-diamide synthase
VAPLLFGFKNFYPGIRLVGAIFNFVNTASHYQFLQEACADVGVEALGYLPSRPEFAIPSRHLGLSIAAEVQQEAVVEALADLLPQTVDLDRLLALTSQAAPDFLPLAKAPLPAQAPRPSIAVARDAAFTFTYLQNLQALAEVGEVTYFSPLVDAALPPDTELLYLPGGYPELFAEVLSQNTAMRASLATYCAAGGAVYAECGGLMYLGQQIIDAQGQAFPMVGALACDTSMEAAELTLGYRTVEWNGLTLKGHEFHYSQLADHGLTPEPARITSAKGAVVPVKLYRQGKVLASYVHLYWGDNKEFIQHLLGLKT